MDEPMQPIVLVGGRSRRFGRDKLLEPLAGGVLVDRPIAALRAVFGPRVLTVGDCDPRVAARADGAIWDRYPGAGPIGGILSALEATGIAVFVLGGDLARADAALVRAVLDRAARAPEASTVLARADRPEPCVGLYRPTAIGPLRSHLGAGRASLHDALPASAAVFTEVAPACLVNVNEPHDLRAERA
jgi:molybdopterin-guanine dinucleotide biosynthesis protein A